jgi:MFS family permease
MAGRGTIPKIYLSNFLTGLVFWYGIEKLFMRHIGITAFGIAVASVGYYAVALLADIPAGILADKWSRKGVLMLSTVSLALASLLCGTSHSLGQYTIGYVFYGFYIVCTSGTYQALAYDVLHEQQRTASYSKVMGRAYAVFLAGAGVANIASGFIARHDNLELPFLLSVVPCAINLVVMAGIVEPHFHKQEQQGKLLPQLSNSVRALVGIAVLRSLTIVWCALAVATPFTQEFSQVYILHFTSNSITVGLLWAGAAFAWALGSMLAHRAKSYFGWYVGISLLPPLVLGFTTRAWGLIVVFAQLALGQVAFNLIETSIQDSTPSAVRTSVLSVVSSLGRIVELPAALLFGWLTLHYGVFAMTRFIAVASAAGLAYWLVRGRSRLKASHAGGAVLIERFNKP